MREYNRSIFRILIKGGRALILINVILKSYFMKKAEYADKNLIIEILATSFDTNASVNYIINRIKTEKKEYKR